MRLLRLPWAAVMLAAVALSALATPLWSAETPDPAAMEFFEKKIRPVLVEHCYECHSGEADELSGGLSLETREGLRSGGDSGPAVASGAADQSLLLSAIQYESYEMPPDGKLPESVIADFRRWIDMGAPDPRVAKSNSGKPASSDTSSSSEEPLWSLQPVSDPQPPEVADSAWPRSDIDRFILARLEDERIAPVDEAAPLTLLRRVYFDLIGLPPSPQAIAEFQADPSRKAYATVVDRLLASPRFGERWGRHWLDVARFAESNGRSRDVLMPHAWRYRDYVIDAFNNDLPYDRFIQEQIAGDLLPADSPAQRDRRNIATGFLALGSKTLVGNTTRVDLVDEQIDAASKAFLGLTVACARCHDHKFDPIPTRDYYALAGIFKSTDTLYGGGLRGPKDDAGKTKELVVLGESADQRSRQARERKQKIDKLAKQRDAAKKKLQQAQKQAKKSKKDDEKQNDEAVEKAKRKLADLEEQLKKAKAAPAPELEFAVGVRDRGSVQDSKIHIRGEVNKLGEVVPRGFLSCIESESPQPSDKQSGRLELARWLTDPQNPVTARVAVNRIWLQLTGRGLVESVDNFGRMGAEPTHPQLLDFLAQRFMQEGWSVKRLIRRIVLSRFYQLSNRYNAANYEADPENTLYWRMNRRRLEAEALRDAMLAASGELQLEPLSEGSLVAVIGDGEVGRNLNTKPLREPFRRRSVYLPIIRGIVPEFLKTFDYPEPSNVQGDRSVTNVPAQSLFLMNSPFVIEQARAMADRIMESAQESGPRVELAFQLALGRPSTSAERKQMERFVKEHKKKLQAADMESDNPTRGAWASLCHALLSSAEFRYLQ